MQKTKTDVTSKKRVRLSPQEREHLIVSGAIDLVAERGFAFSTRELADHLGMSQSLLYRYFATKEALIDKIYERVYVGRWNPEWDEMLIDRDVSLQARLETYFADYANVVLQKDWIRIFLLSAFDDPVIAQRYTTMLRRRIFEPILAEQLHELGKAEIKDATNREIALEMIWGFHSTFFYIGIRQWVFKVPPKIALSAMMKDRIAAFLAGLRGFLATVAS